MPRTTLGLRTFRARPTKRSASGGNLDVDGKPLMERLGAYLNRAISEPIVDDRKSRYLRAVELIPRGHSLTVVMRSGHYGDRGVTYNVATHEETHVKGTDEAATLDTRATFWAPPGAEWFVLAYEMRAGALHGGVLFDDFHRKMREAHPGFYFPNQSLMEADAWAASGELTGVAVVQPGHSFDLSVPSKPDTVGGKVVYTAVPPKGQRAWPKRVWDLLRNGDVDPYAFLNIANVDPSNTNGPDDSVLVTVERDGRQKTFELGRDGKPSVRVLLTESSEPLLDMDRFQREVESNVRDYYQSGGYAWNPKWAKSAAAESWAAAHD